MDKIKEIFEEVLQMDGFEECEDFIAEGIVDSLDIMELVEALEEVFSIEISGRDIIPENFANLETVAELVRKYEGNL